MEEIHVQIHDGLTVPCDVGLSGVGVGADDGGFDSALGKEGDEFICVFRRDGKGHAFL